MSRIIKYCPKCHKEAYRVYEAGEAIEVMQGGNTILKLNKKSKVNLKLKCPDGHSVKYKLKPEEENGTS